MNTYKRLCNVAGWLIFAITLAVYSLTIEPTVSYWDSGEFISAAHKLEIPHAPGAPLYMLVGRLFSLMAGENLEQVAFWVNMVSAVSSAFTVLFLFRSITLLGKKLLNLENAIIDKQKALLLLASGAVGALAFAFSDSFWFSAVEAEVYALSSFFTAFVFWAILKWEAISDQATANRWLILIAFMTGLSVGVHPLNLLTLPCLGLIYYFKRYRFSVLGVFLTLGLSGLVLVFLMFGFRIGLLGLITSFELFAVNNLGWPFGWSIGLSILAIAGGLGYGLYSSQKNNKAVWNTALLCMTFVLIGYSSYAIIIIRSNQNPPLDTANPEHIISFKSYLNMESFGSRPFFYGPYFNTQVIDQKQGRANYSKGETFYQLQGHDLDYIYDNEGVTIFPRAWSSREGHPEAYKKLMGLKPGETPSFAQNIKFMFQNQMGHMYARYFLWNFAGRQSDIQNSGWLAPWESTKALPDSLANNKARNNYFMLPLLLGLLGMIFTFRKNVKNFWVIMLLFLTTGIILVIYLNGPPFEPRERDYIYVGSYFAFAIWIGLGVLGLHRYFERFFPKLKWAPALVTVLGLVIPSIMLQQGWNDHDRSDRYYAEDAARNILTSCPENAILFTGADNDTYALWYLQEVEGFRTDVRVLVTTYYNTGWYIHQMQQQANQSAPIPFTMDSAHYIDGGSNDYLPLVENPNLEGQPIDLKQYLGLIKEEHPALQLATRFGDNLHLVPSKAFYLDVPVEKVKTSGSIPNSKLPWIQERVQFDLKDKRLLKGDLALLDIIVANQWGRAICFTPTAINNVQIDLTPYLLQSGPTYELLPIKSPSAQPGMMVDTEQMYKHMMQNSQWRNLDDPSVYYSTYYQNQMLNPRSNFNLLAAALLQKGEKEKAREVLLYSLDKIPNDTIPYDITSAQSVKLLLDSGAHQAASAVAKVLSTNADQELNYYLGNNPVTEAMVTKQLSILQYLAQSMKESGYHRESERYNQSFNRHFEKAKKLNLI